MTKTRFDRLTRLRDTMHRKSLQELGRVQSGLDRSESAVNELAAAPHHKSEVTSAELQLFASAVQMERQHGDTLREEKRQLVVEEQRRRIAQRQMQILADKQRVFMRRRELDQEEKTTEDWTHGRGSR